MTELTLSKFGEQVTREEWLDVTKMSAVCTLLAGAASAVEEIAFSFDGWRSVAVVTGIGFVLFFGLIGGIAWLMENF